MPRLRPQRSLAAGLRSVCALNWRRLGMSALVLCCGILAAGPSLAILFPQPVSESAPSEEETKRVDAEEFCSRVPSRRLSPLPAPASDVIVNALYAIGLSRTPRPAMLGHRPAQLDQDVKLGSGAPLRC